MISYADYTDDERATYQELLASPVGAAREVIELRRKLKRRARKAGRGETMTLAELVTKAHDTALSKGWYDGDDAGRNIPEMLALIHSEVSEALEDYRDGKMETWADDKGKPQGFPVELADIVIRVADLCGYLGIDLEKAVVEKMSFNATRPRRHGGKRA